MSAVERAMLVRDKLIALGYPFLGTELLLEVGNESAWPLVQVWDDAAEVLRLIAFVEQDHQLAAGLQYAREAAERSGYGAMTVCYAIGRGERISEAGATLYEAEFKQDVSHGANV